MQLVIIGGGPAGLRAAEIAAAAGVSVTVFEAKASVGRKFLVAGKGGLNLTNAESREEFLPRYSAGPWSELLAECDAEALRAWLAELGVETFAASSGRVYPREMKAAPLLRRWVHRLRGLGVQFAVHHRWMGLRAGARWQVKFSLVPSQAGDGTDGPHVTHDADAVLLALGGASWPETGSDGSWTAILEKLGVSIAPLAPANCGWEVAWPPEVLAHEGAPLKNIVARAGDAEARGELLITRYGLEGGAIYQLGPALRAMREPALVIDFKPSLTGAQLAEKLAPAQRVALLEAARRWNLNPAVLAIVRAPQIATPLELAAAVKQCRIRLTQPRPIAEAISTAGGVRWSELDDSLMLRALPGVFVAGEMIDWEAPTGGYLIQGCFATGTRAARGAVAWLRGTRDES
ncbi:MAG: TIGR03862 family flavoprotein [Chthoniobacteraceae bacterium]